MSHQPQDPTKFVVLALSIMTVIMSACSSTTQPESAPESPEKPEETTATDLESTTTVATLVSTTEEQASVTFESCTVTFDQVPVEPMEFADVGEGGFVPGEGDCDRVNIYTGAQGDPISKPWNEQQILLCSLLPVPDVGVLGDYSIHVKSTNGEEIHIERDQSTELAEGTTIDSIRFDLGDNVVKPPRDGNDYLGKCQLANPETGYATEIGFSLDTTGTTQPEPYRFGTPE